MLWLLHPIHMPLFTLLKTSKLLGHIKYTLSPALLSLHLSGLNSLLMNGLVHVLTPGGQPDS